MNKQVMLLLAEAIKQGKDVALLTIVDQQGSSPRRNAMMLIDSVGNVLAGSVGGGGIEKKAIEDALSALKNRENALHHYSLKMSKDDPKALQMACGGDVSLYISTHCASKRLVVVGAGHISLALSKLARMLGYRYAVIDDRPEYANNMRFADAEIIIERDILQAINDLETTENDAFVIVSHDHIHDLDALKILVGKSHFYLGMIGSKKKVKYVYHQVEKSGIILDESKIHAPIGLDIGGETPEEIALSIMAEIQAVRYGRGAESLKERRK